MLIFDLDGTLADTAPDLIATLNRVTEPHGLAKITMDQVGQIVGQGARVMMERAFAINGCDLPPALLESLFDEFLQDYAANIANESYLFDGVRETLTSLKSQGYQLSVCTNKPENLARQLLEELGVTEYFAAITGGDTFPFKKPDGRHLAETVKIADCDLGATIMIGDSITDINAARDAGVPSIAVSFGYSDIPVTELGATAIISHYHALEEAISRIRSTL